MAYRMVPRPMTVLDLKGHVRLLLETFLSAIGQEI